MHLRTTLLAFAAGCYQPPDLPVIDEVPIEPVAPAACDVDVEYVACAIDGDTYDLGNCGDESARVRVLGLDAPEIGHSDGEVDDCYGAEATQELERLLAGSRVKLTFDPSTWDDEGEDCRGLFGRLLAYTWLHVDDVPFDADTDDLESGDEEWPLLVNEWMIRRGYARLHRGFPEIRRFERFDNLEAQARSREFGLWGACDE
jgi:micrococcal nuclease